jgi:hypothetical protein
MGHELGDRFFNCNTVNTRSIFHVKLRFFYGICHIKGLQIP